jgi:hypothetical protein
MLCGELVPTPDPANSTGDAKALLLPALASRDPEVCWRLASRLLAFADHAAEFYAGSGNDGQQALELARANAENRPTRRAVKQAHAMAKRLLRS